MNREQRRAAMKQAGKIKGFDISKGTLEVDIKDSDEKLVVDVMDFGVTDAIHDLYMKFNNLEESYKDEYEKAFKSGINDTEAKYQLMKKIIVDFSTAVDNIFGEGACIKLFGHKYPQLVQIAEFNEDFAPVALAIIQSSGIDTLTVQDMANNSKVVEMPSSAPVAAPPTSE